ncbi:ferredoxin--nitrite reductase [Clostridium gelidum]|uniref:Ferredoxin--nitrite reductase n=1 Tax=Clostridium gelidum TaxID=704125 RepID=A0ABM7T520_9CLOT|nr:nitrite/sulfite reductase [Clostridium gelidum]BCZ46735.1 ferredoxin--nitrite reductase [Clostridium gelidum]
MNNLKQDLLIELEDFKRLGDKFLCGEVSIGDFKKVSGGMGVYSERSKKEFMIRLRIPSGITNINQMNWLCGIAEKYELDKFHLTTREAIQYHNLSIDQTCSIMKDGIDNDIYSRGGGGNFPRNVAMSPLSGVDKSEAFDVTPYALAVNNHFLSKITTYKLPRKFKVSFSSNNDDLGHCNVTDLGFLAIIKDNKKYFKVYMGGGLGRNPKIGIEYDELIDPSEVLYHVDAMTNLFVKEGDYENRNKARIRFILERMGTEKFIETYKEHLKEVLNKEDLNLAVTSKEYTKEGKELDIKHSRLFEQKQKGLYSVYFHPIGGQIYIEKLRGILDKLKGIEDLEIRLTMTEGMFFRNLNGEEAKKVLEMTQDLGGETAIEQSVSCIGVPICQVGILESQKTLNNIINYFKEKGYKKDVLPRIHVSGCGNSCAVHEVVGIGLTGKRKKVNDTIEDVFELHINGSFETGDARLGKVYGDILACEIPRFLYELSLLVENKNISFDDYVKTNEVELVELIGKYIK